MWRSGGTSVLRLVSLATCAVILVLLLYHQTNFNIQLPSVWPSSPTSSPDVSPDHEVLSDVTRTEKLPSGRPLYNTAMDDPELLEMIRQSVLVPPSPHSYNLTSPNKSDYSQYGQTKFVERMLRRQRSGFFVESGALDGERFSNTLHLEKMDGWTGLLVEPDPRNFAALLKKHRHSYLANVCLSDTKHPAVAELVGMVGGGGDDRYWSKEKNDFLQDKKRNKHRNKIFRYKALCVPLYSLLLAMKVERVDYMSLDVEGPELEILRTIPFELIDFQLLGIEWAVYEGFRSNQEKGREKLGKIRDFFAALDTRYKEVQRAISDVFFLKENV